MVWSIETNSLVLIGPEFGVEKILHDVVKKKERLPGEGALAIMGCYIF